VSVKKPTPHQPDALDEAKAIDSAKDPIAASEAWLKKFPRSTLVEDVTYNLIEMLVRAGRKDEAHRVAADYLKQFPHGTYAELVSRLAAQK
jgi:TolA-binding protein